MIVRYAPEGQEPQTRELRPHKLMLSQIKLIERTFASLVGRSRVTLFDLEGALIAESTEARQLLVWFLFQPEKPVDEVDFVWDDVTVTFTKEDWARQKARAVENIMDARDRDEAVAEFDARMALAPDSPEGKAPSPPSSAGTGSPSSRSSESTRATSRGSRSKR